MQSVQNHPAAPRKDCGLIIRCLWTARVGRFYWKRHNITHNDSGAFMADNPHRLSFERPIYELEARLAKLDAAVPQTSGFATKSAASAAS